MASIRENLQLFNSVLIDMKRPELDKNNAFSLSELSDDLFLKYKITNNKLFFSIDFSNEYIQIDLDRVVEAFVFHGNDLSSKRANTYNTIKMILTHEIEIEYYGRSYTKIKFYDGCGILVKTVRYLTGFFIGLNCQRRRVEPIY